MTEIDKLFSRTLTGTGDSDKHLMTLFGIALGCPGNIFIELGVRDGATTAPLKLAAEIKKGKLHSVDIEPFSSTNTENWEFHQSCAIEFLSAWEKNRKDIPALVYIDDWHAADHVKKELDILDHIVSPSTVILIHDTQYGGHEPFYHCDLAHAGDQWAGGGPYRAVAELNPQFWEFSTLPWNNGLTILRKKYSSRYNKK